MYTFRLMDIKVHEKRKRKRKKVLYKQIISTEKASRQNKTSTSRFATGVIRQTQIIYIYLQYIILPSQHQSLCRYFVYYYIVRITRKPTTLPSNTI